MIVCVCVCVCVCSPAMDPTRIRDKMNTTGNSSIPTFAMIIPVGDSVGGSCFVG